ncbi:methyltransferase domain-containing protein [Planctomycetota bacterium]
MEKIDNNLSKANEYRSGDYISIHRFASFYYQISLTLQTGPKRILEIGVGNKIVSSYFKNIGLDIVTSDINPDLSPDVLADVTKLPFEDGAFDTVLAFEVLEHLPWEKAIEALAELSRVSSKTVIISLPYHGATFEMMLKLPFNKFLFKKSYLNFFARLPLSIFNTKIKTPDHFWEIGRKGFGLKKVRKAICEKLVIEKEVRAQMNPNHYFFVLHKTEKN